MINAPTPSALSSCTETTVDHTPRHRQLGFTLLEIMVAMVVLTLIVTASFGALRLGEKSWESGLKHSSKTENLRTVTGALKRLFNQALPISWKDNAQTVLAFYGETETLRFIGPAPQHQGSTGLFEYNLVVEPHAGATRLMLYYRLHNPDIPDFAEEDSESEHVVLVEDLDSAQFRYFGAPKEKDPLLWHSMWSSDAENYPLLVHVDLQARQQRDQWPELFLTLNAEHDE